MTKHLQRDMDTLRRQLLILGRLVQEATDRSIEAIDKFDRKLLEDVHSREARINQMEVDIEEECLKMLALHQPVAIDLRFIIVVLKVNNDLERMGDQAVNIADRVQFLIDQRAPTSPVDFAPMASVARDMVEMGLKALVEQDASMARKVLEMDDELDRMHAETYRIMQEDMARQPDQIRASVSYLTISSNLERIGDLSTNIAEEVIFMEEGEVIRHQGNF